MSQRETNKKIKYRQKTQSKEDSPQNKKTGDENEEKTSADYYFDSYSHFGLFFFWFFFFEKTKNKTNK